MSDTILVATTFVLAAVATILLAFVLHRSRQRRRTQYRRLDERLAETHTQAKTHLETPPRVRSLAVVDRTDEGESVYVPVVRVDLETAEAPGMDLIFEFVASVLEAIHPLLEEDEKLIRHYDVQFTFGPDGLFVSRLCQRVSVPPTMAERLCTDPDYDAFDLRRAVERGDDGDETTAPVLWGACRSVT